MSLRWSSCLIRRFRCWVSRGSWDRRKSNVTELRHFLQVKLEADDQQEELEQVRLTRRERRELD